MKAFSALRLIACASIFSIAGVTKSSAQLFYHVVDLDSGSVDSNNNLGVAVNITFNFAIVSNVGTLTIKLENLAGTARSVYNEGLGNYTTGILTGFGFDLPGMAPNFETPVMNYVAGSFQEISTNDPDGVNFAPISPFSETNPEGTFDIGAVTNTPQPIANGLAGGKTATFSMQFTGNLSSFNPQSFFANNGSDADFGFRYQSVGFNGSGSDKFVYYDNPPIPEPSTYGFVAATFLLAMVGLKRRLRAKELMAA